MNGPALNLLLQSCWLLEPRALEVMADIVIRHDAGIRLSKEEIDARLKAAAGDGQRNSPGYSVKGNVAMIPIYGVLEKRASYFSDVSGMVSTQKIEQDVNAALSDGDVRSILLDIDSPGGSVDGIAELGDLIFAARQKKPIWARANGQMASAAYWLGAQAEQIFSGRAAQVGAIGVYTVMYDTSALYKKEGVKVHVVKAGEMKATGARGTELTDAQLADVQRQVNAIYELFVTAVAVGRGLSEDQARALADGRIHLGAAAQKLGLVDGVETLDSVVAKMQALSPISNPSARADISKGEKQMSDKTEEKPAGDDGKSRFAALEAAFPGETAFVAEQFKKGNDVFKAKAEFSDVLQARLKASQDENVKLKGEAGKPGVKGLKTPKAVAEEGEEVKVEGGTASETFRAKVDELVEKGASRDRAVMKVAAKNPELHRAMLEEANGAAGAAAYDEKIGS